MSINPVHNANQIGQGTTNSTDQVQVKDMDEKTIRQKFERFSNHPEEWSKLSFSDQREYNERFSELNLKLGNP